MAVARRIDRDARWFVAHLVGAIQVACPDSMTKTAKMVAAPQVPDEGALVTELSNRWTTSMNES